MDWGREGVESGRAVLLPIGGWGLCSIIPGAPHLHPLKSAPWCYSLSPIYILGGRTHPSSPLDNIRVMVIVWRLRWNIIRTVLCRIVWHNVLSQQHTYMSSSYTSNRLGLSHWDPYAVHRGGCLKLYYCNMVEWFWWDSSLISTTN